MAESTKKSRLPPKSEDKIVEVTLKEVVIASAVVFVSVVAISAGIIALRDYSRYRRQKALIDSVQQIVTIVYSESEAPDEAKN